MRCKQHTHTPQTHTFFKPLLIVTSLDYNNDLLLSHNSSLIIFWEESYYHSIPTTKVLPSSVDDRAFKNQFELYENEVFMYKFHKRRGPFHPIIQKQSKEENVSASFFASTNMSLCFNF